MSIDTPRTVKNNGPTSEKDRRDNAIMGTNNSSIVSKRSVERLYSRADERQFLRYFVKKPQRRSPLINRGYWLRMQAVEHVVRSFVFEELHDSKRKKIVINLGCGYDPLPFQFISSTGGLENILYIDIDYPDLVSIKSRIISETPEVYNLVKNPQFNDPPVEHVHYRSAQYLAIGCDLRELEKLKHILIDSCLITDAALLFTAEVSLAYMGREAVDALVAWAATLPDARFSILEQCLPSGPSHPFARTMLKHFNRLCTPLKSVDAYPTLSSQAARFSDRGWKTVDTLDLLAFWSSLVTESQRKHLESVEPFDEWEEFFIFCQHYFVTHARTGGAHQKDPGPFRPEGGIKWRGGEYVGLPDPRPSLARVLSSEESRIEDGFNAEFTAFPLLRRWLGAAAEWGIGQWIYHGGLGSSTRLGTSLLIAEDRHEDLIKGGGELSLPAVRGPDARMCHTLTQLVPGKVLLVGGRASPDKPMKDVWVLESRSWRKVQDLPWGRYRHCATAVGSQKALICGGKGAGNAVLDDWLLWSEDRGWTELKVDAERRPSPRFGASLCWTDRGYGILSGGMDGQGQVLGDIWRLELVEGNRLIVRWSFVNLLSTRSLLKRFGARSVYLEEGRLLVIGGVSGGALLKSEDEVVEIHCEKLTVKGIDIVYQNPREKLPFFIGHQVLSVGQGRFCVVGGGGICFSFGARFNEGIWALVPPDIGASTGGWKVSEEGEILEKKRKKVAAASMARTESGTAKETPTEVREVKKTRITSQEDFRKIRYAGEPVVIQGLDIGKCVERWSLTYLKETVGHERKVVVHSTRSHHMSFQARNFSYKTMSFGEFIDTIASPDTKELLYLRSLSASNPTSTPSNLHDDFPSIAQDFAIPPELQFAKENQHSSPLRISSRQVGMWLHFDVMANILCHISGTKLFRLYPPADITKLSFPPGASSSSIENPFDPNTSPEDVHPIEVILNPGDVLFIPELWPHAALPLGPCVAVNVFFKSLDKGYSSGRDLYGNRDLAAYEKGRTFVGRIQKEFEELPSTARRFYMERLADELAALAES